MAAIVLLSTVPLLWYANTMARLQREGLPQDPHVEMHHWTTMAGAAVAIWFVGWLASMRPPGWRLVAWFAAAAAFVLGLAFVIYPTYPGSEGTTWGIVAMAGAGLFAAAAEREARRTRQAA